MIAEHWRTLVFMQCRIRLTAFPISIINELVHWRQRSLGRFLPPGNHLDNVLSNNVGQQRCVTRTTTCLTLQPPTPGSLAHLGPAAVCIRPGRCISSRLLFRFRRASFEISVISHNKVIGMRQTVTANAVNTGRYRDTTSPHWQRQA